MEIENFSRNSHFGNAEWSNRRWKTDHPSVVESWSAHQPPETRL
jgi:hypothetical protein